MNQELQFLIYNTQKNIFEVGELAEEMVISKMETTTEHGAIKGNTQI